MKTYKNEFLIVLKNRFRKYFWSEFIKANLYSSCNFELGFTSQIFVKPLKSVKINFKYFKTGPLHLFPNEKFFLIN